MAIVPALLCILPEELEEEEALPCTGGVWVAVLTLGAVCILEALVTPVRNQIPVDPA